MKKSEFLHQIVLAGDKLLQQCGPKPRNLDLNDDQVLAAAVDVDSRAAVAEGAPMLVLALYAAAFERDNPLRVFATAEAAWEESLAARPGGG